jgi:molecular chaperone DnaK
MASDNKSLGRFVLDGIPPAPRGVPQIEVTFDLDANGILNVKAVDKGTNKEQKITIQGSSGISKEEVERMREEAEKHAEEDKKRKEAVEIRVSAEGLVTQSERTLKEAGDKVSDEIKQPVDEKIKTLKELLENTDSDIEAVKKATEELSEAIQKVGAAMYEQATPDANSTANNDSATNTDNVVDGETVDNDKKE